MKTYNIYKKRDGQSFKIFGEIYADSFEAAKKQFALNMTQDNHKLSNNVVWLSKEEDGVNETGWYSFNGNIPTYNEETEKYDANEAADCLLVSEADINEGFDTWTEDVYTWELRDSLEYEEIFDKDDFEINKDEYEFLMVYQGERYFLYNGDFKAIAQSESLSKAYDQYSSDFVGCAIKDDADVNLLLKYLN